MSDKIKTHAQINKKSIIFLAALATNLSHHYNDRAPIWRNFIQIDFLPKL
jgi:hypothetical protein